MAQPVHSQVSKTMPATNVLTATLDTTYNPRPRGFITTSDGTLRTTNMGGDIVGIPVKGGLIYAIELNDVLSSSIGIGAVVLLM